MGPPNPEASMSRNAPVRGEPSSVLMAAKLPAAASTDWTLSGASRLTRRTTRAPSPAPRAINGPSGPEDHAQAQGRECRQHDAGQFDSGRSASARLEPVGR